MIPSKLWVFLSSAFALLAAFVVAGCGLFLDFSEESSTCRASDADIDDPDIDADIDTDGAIETDPHDGDYDSDHENSCENEICEDICCSIGEVCYEGNCCSPICGGRECGSDSCGGACSPGCSSSQHCIEGTGRCMQGFWATIPVGDFVMGSPGGEAGRASDERQFDATLTRSFVILSNEVTQAEFEALMSYNPSSFTACGEQCPVEGVNWHVAAAFCNRLSEEENLETCYSCDGIASDVICTPIDDHENCLGFRLPTEAEWEFATRAGTTDATYEGNLNRDQTGCEENDVLDSIAWFCANSHVTYENAGDCTKSGGSSTCGTHPVATLEPNDWGLHDTLGNVWEWCNDWFGDYPSGPESDWQGPADGSSRVFRGGSYYQGAESSRSANRGKASPSYSSNRTGIRPVRTIP